MKIDSKFLDVGGYYHELSIQGRMDLCANIPRSKRKTYPWQPPNFYNMPMIDGEDDMSSYEGIKCLNEPRKIEYKR